MEDINDFNALIDAEQEEVGAADPINSAIDQEHQEIVQEEKTEKYGSLAQQGITALEGAAEGIAGPLAPIAEVSLGLASKEDINARAEENPMIKGGSELAGLVGSTLIPGGQGALLTKAGSAASKGLGLAGKTGWIAKATDGAVRGAVESAVFQGGKELSEAYLGDPKQVADHAMLDIGLSGVLGGVFGGPLGVIAKALSKEKQALVSQIDALGVEAGDLKSIVASDASLAPAKKESLLEALNIGKKKANAKEIEGVAAELGLPETPGMTLDSSLVSMQVDALANSPYSIAGNRVRTQLDEAYQGVENVLRESTESANKLTRDELGGQLQESLSGSIRTAYAPQKAAYAELAALHESIPVEPEALEGLAKVFSEIKEVKLSPNTSEGRLVREVLDLAKSVKTAEDLTTIRNMASLKSEPGDPLRWLKGKIRDELAQLQKDSIRSYSKSFPRNDEAGALFASKLEMADAASAAYAPYIKKVNELSNWLGKGKIHGTEDALNFMTEKLSATDVAKRLFSSSKDPAFLKFFSKEFTEQYQLIRDYQRMELIEAATKDGVLNPKAFFKKFNGLEPEVQKSLYTPEEIKKIKAAELYMREAFPKNFNPSGTDHVRALRSAYESPKGLALANVRDATMEKLIHLAEKGSDLYNAHALGKSIAKGWKMANDSVKAVVHGGKELPSKIIPMAAHREKLDKLVSESTKNPDRLFGINDNNPVEELNQPFAETSAKAVAYLNSLKPQTEPKAALDSKRPVSKAQQAAYNRALDIAQQPLITMKYIQEGTLASQDVTTLKTIYPGLYARLANQLMSEIVTVRSQGKLIPYKTKLGLSVFLGEPLDSTLAPTAILAAQPAPDAPPQKQGGSIAPSYNSVKGLDSLAKGSRTPNQASQQRNIAKD